METRAILSAMSKESAEQFTLSVKEAAERLGVDVMTVRRYADKGLIRHRRLPASTGGRGWRRFRPSDIDQFSRSYTLGSSAPPR